MARPAGKSRSGDGAKKPTKSAAKKRTAPASGAKKTAAKGAGRRSGSAKPKATPSTGKASKVQGKRGSAASARGSTAKKPPSAKDKAAPRKPRAKPVVDRGSAGTGGDQKTSLKERARKPALPASRVPSASLRSGGRLRRGGRWRRFLPFLLLAALLAWFVLLPYLGGLIAEEELTSILGVPVKVSRVSGLYRRRVVLHGVTARREGADVPFLSVDRIVVEFERAPLTGDPGDVIDVLLEEGHLRWIVGGDAARSVEAKEPPRGLETKTASSKESAPSASSEVPELRHPLDFPDRIAIRNSRVDIEVQTGGRPWILPFTEVDAVLLRHDKTVGLEEVTARLCGGRVTGFASLQRRRPSDWKLQATVADVNAGELVRTTPLATEVTEGQLAAFIELAGPPPGQHVPLGAGWLSVRQSHLWKLPIFSGILDGLGLLAGHGDYVREARAQFRVDRGAFHFRELSAVGSPISLYGNGWMAWDGSEVEADFVPRFGRGLTNDLPVIGEPSQLLLDIAKGIALEVRLRGTLADPEVSTLPLPIVTGPIAAFFRLVSGN